VTVFVDTSAIYALINSADRYHPSAARLWPELILRNEDLVSTSYVQLESLALSQARIGLDAARRIVTDVAPFLRIHWVDEPLHERGVVAWLAAGSRHPSLVDWVSFEFMRRFGLTTAFAFDDDFVDQGFTCLQ
jgi:uncharacterized protein